jgi:hypothetical protein
MHGRVPPRGGFRIAERNRQTEAARRGPQPRKAAFSVHRDQPADRRPGSNPGRIRVQLLWSLRASRTGLIIDTSIVGNMRKTAVTELPSTGGAGTDRGSGKAGDNPAPAPRHQVMGMAAKERSRLASVDAAGSIPAISTWRAEARQPQQDHHPARNGNGHHPARIPATGPG